VVACCWRPSIVVGGGGGGFAEQRGCEGAEIEVVRYLDIIKIRECYVLQACQQIIRRIAAPWQPCHTNRVVGRVLVVLDRLSAPWLNAKSCRVVVKLNDLLCVWA